MFETVIYLGTYIIGTTHSANIFSTSVSSYKDVNYTDEVEILPDHYPIYLSSLKVLSMI
jgi:hypothetical protein